MIRHLAVAGLLALSLAVGVTLPLAASAQTVQPGIQPGGAASANQPGGVRPGLRRDGVRPDRPLRRPSSRRRGMRRGM